MREILHLVFMIAKKGENAMRQKNGRCTNTQWREDDRNYMYFMSKLFEIVA